MKIIGISLSFLFAASVQGAVTINPVADAYVRGGGDADNNFGSEVTLEIKDHADTYHRLAYLRFDLSTISEPFDSAILRLKLTADSATGSDTHTAYFVSDDTWVETTITYNSKPVSGASLDSAGLPGNGSWIELDVGDQVIAEAADDQLFSVVISSGSGTHAKYHSREAAAESDGPQLVLESSGPPDTDPPTPNPATWALVPTADGAFMITMTAITGVDSNAVEYLFEETSGNSGGTDSGWQSDPTYTDIGLYPDTPYSYTVMMRDTVGNSGTVSSVASVSTPEVTGRTNGPPNVVFIFADDLGHADISRNAAPGSLVHTPNIDRICEEGIYLSTYMTHHVCSPSRAGLITGRHYTEVGSGVETGGVLDNSVPNIAKDFKAAGYATGAFGKWHNGDGPYSDDGSMVLVNGLGDIVRDDQIYQYLSSDGFGEGVNAYGFDDWTGYYDGGPSYHTRAGRRDSNWWSNGAYVGYVPGYTTDLIQDHALNFIDAHAHEPFFLYVPMEAVHFPRDLLNTDLEEMCAIWDDVYPSLAWSEVGELVSPSTGNKIKDVLELYCDEGKEFDRKVLDVTIPGFEMLVYYTIDYAMDEATGAILDRLDAYGLTTNTIVVFASDNGGTSEEFNFPFRGVKHTVWEGGVHVPAAIWWPGHVESSQAPYSPVDNEYTNMTQYLDWYPTLIAMAGQTVTAAELDGMNIYSNLLARTPVRPDLENCYYGLDLSWCTVRSDRWKLHFTRALGQQVLELYDMYNDVSETTNVQATYPVERDALIGLLDAWFATKDVTASYMPLTGESIPRYADPIPFGDILEVTATQTGSLSDPDSEGVYFKFAGSDKESYVHAADMFIYDIYVAEDSEQVSGMFCSPTLGVGSPRFNSRRGIHTNSIPLVAQILPKGQWVRMMSGMGEVAANGSYASLIGLHSSVPGTYHFYIDNMSIRKGDGSLRGVGWDNSSDTSGPRYYVDGEEYSWSELAASPGFAFSEIDFKTVDLSSLPTTPQPGSSYTSWASAIGGGIENYDPAGAGPINSRSILMEYGLGSDPNTYTEGLARGTDAPDSQQLGTYTFRNLLVESQIKDYMTLTFDLNRAANDIEVVVSESTNLVDWVDALVLRPPYTDTSVISANEQVIDVEDNLSGYPVDTTRITARSGTAIDDEQHSFIKLEVRPLVANPESVYLTAGLHDGILLEWGGTAEGGEFILERTISGSGSFSELVRTESPLYTDTSASNGQTYDYRVRAYNAAGSTDWSNIVTITR